MQDAAETFQSVMMTVGMPGCACLRILGLRPKTMDDGQGMMVAAYCSPCFLDTSPD